MLDLANKVAIITGGGYGIGREIALAYGRAGARIVLAARSQGPLAKTRSEIERAGAQALAIPTDVSKENDCKRMVDGALSAFGRVDILVNNAGIAGPTQRVTEMTLAGWQEVIDINLTGAWLAARAVLPVMERQGSGNILNIASIAGRRGFSLRTPYVASKWGMLGLTQALAREWGTCGVRVNCICPGAVEGDRIERVIRARAETLKVPQEAIREEILGPAAMHRMVTEEETARVALFLVSDLSAGMTGQTINVDAGTTMN